MVDGESTCLATATTNDGAVVSVAVAFPVRNPDGTVREADTLLLDIFGFSELRPGQAAVIDDVLAGRPVVAVMPTGAGKSLCYQLPAIVLGERGGVTLVVSPLIALM